MLGIRRRAGAAAVAVVAAAWAAAAWADIDPEQGDYDWGFLAARFTDVHGAHRHRGLGPVLESSSSPDGESLRAVRPLYSRAEDPEAERITREILWPLCVKKSFQEAESWRVLTLYALDFDRDDPASRYRFWFVPFYFQGRDAEGKNYLALFPLAGTFREFLGRDRIAFVLFPLRATSTLNDIEASHVLWPIYMRARGEGVYRFRLFPFYMQSRLRDEYVKRAVMWPFYSQARFSYPDASGSGYIVWPLWGHIDLDTEETWMAIPPLFRVTRSDELTTMYLPFPFIQYSSGTEEKLYILPIWGKKTQHGSHSTFLLWPIFHRQRIDKGDEVFHRFLALPFWHWHEYRARPETPGSGEEVNRAYARLWPLFSYQRVGDASRVRALALSPFRRMGPIERNFASFWTLYERSAAGDARQTEVLWGLYRHHRTGDELRYLSVFPFVQYRRVGERAPDRSWSVLKGLVGRERSGDQTSWRFLYFIRTGKGERGE